MIPAGSSGLLMAGGGLKPLWEILASAGLQGNATLCFDAGDLSSWGGSGQQWNDRSSNANHFYLGETSSSESSDPTFTGSAGDLTNAAYWSLNGSNHFHNSLTNAAFMDAWHKAGATYTLITALYLPGGSDSGGIIGGPGGATTPGISFQLNTGKPVIYVENAGAGTPLQVTADSAMSSGWHMLALSITDPGATGFFYADGSYNQVSASNTFNAAYSSPASGASSYAYNIGYGPSNGTGAAHLPSGTRMMGFAALNKAASKAELDTVWALLRKRLGI